MIETCTVTFYSIDKKSFEDYTPKFQFTKLSLDFVTKYAHFLHEIIFNIFVKQVLSSFCFLIELKKMFEMSSFCLPQALRRWSHWAIAFSIILRSIAAHTPDVIVSKSTLILHRTPHLRSFTSRM